MTAVAGPGGDLATRVAADVVVAGPADAPAIVFVHSTRLTKAMWTAQQAELAGEFRTIAVDLPAHGARADEVFTLEAASDVVAATIRDHAGGRAIVCGLSLGGYVAIALGARHPELVRGLVLSGCSTEPGGLLRLPILVLAWALSNYRALRLDGYDGWFFRWRYPATIAEPIVAGGFWSEGGASALRALVDEPIKPRLATYPGPTLIVNGELDWLFRLGAPGFAAAARDPRRLRLGGAVHLANLDRSAAFSEAVRRFARSLGPA